WVRVVSGRLESRYSYAPAVYNNFPWPQLDAPGYIQTVPCADGLCVREAAARLYWSSYHEGGETEDVPLVAKHVNAGLKGGAKKIAAVEAASRKVLAARAWNPTSTLADMYDPLLMPPDLVRAHADLDRAVDRCYRAAPFTSDRQRVEFLFALYEQYSAPLLPSEKKKRRRTSGQKRLPYATGISRSGSR
ncbi:MAG: hypothetical protein PHN85_04055, partial [Kiritimatiellae bacterium]|nr:hypothetical protein [Kiritimatiellia bacterium]